MFINVKAKDGEEFVKCNDCGCILLKEDAQKVEGYYYINYYYCGSHQKKYDRWTIDANGKSIYFSSKERQVDKEGNLIECELP